MRVGAEISFMEKRGEEKMGWARGFAGIFVVCLGLGGFFLLGWDGMGWVY